MYHYTTLHYTTLHYTAPFIYIHVFPRKWVRVVRRDADSGMWCTVIFVINKGMLNSKINSYLIELFFFFL